MFFGSTRTAIVFYTMEAIGIFLAAVGAYGTYFECVFYSFVKRQCLYICIEQIGNIRFVVSGESGYGSSSQQQRGTREKKFFLYDLKVLN